MGKILTIDLTRRTISTIKTKPYAARFLGGLGIGQKLYWDLAPANVSAFDPDNPLIFMTGPLTGTTAPGASRLSICSKSPCLYPETFVSGSLGGHFPTDLKQAGYDGLVVSGRADAPVYLKICDGTAEIKDAGALWGCTNSETHSALEKEIEGRFSLLSIGPAGENQTRIGNISSDLASSAATGLGSVMGSKQLKAVVAMGSGSIKTADPAAMKKIRKQIRAMKGEGFFNLFADPSVFRDTEVVKKVHCTGCPDGCWRTLQRIASGEEGVRKCQMGMFYALWDMRYHGGSGTDTSFKAVTLANDLGFCLLELIYLFLWIDLCSEKEILTDEQVGLPLAELGSLDFLEKILKLICAKEGFGKTLAKGVVRASIDVGEPSREITTGLLTESGRGVAYGPKVFFQSALIYATEPKPAVTELHGICEPLTKWARWHLSDGVDTYVSTAVLRQIAKRFWGSEQAADFSDYDGMALAALKVQNRETVKESLILCDFLFPVYDDAGREDHVGDPTLERRILSAAIGREITEAEIDRFAERIFSLGRAIQLRDGRQGRTDDRVPAFTFEDSVDLVPDVFAMHNRDLLLPGKGEEIISRRGKGLDRNGFERMLDEYYDLRGWDRTTGYFKKETLEKLDLTDVMGEIKGQIV
jgi:aldehyde:ferredoxin oxidoreductase